MLEVSIYCWNCHFFKVHMWKEIENVYRIYNPFLLDMIYIAIIELYEWLSWYLKNSLQNFECFIYKFYFIHYLIILTKLNWVKYFLIYL